MKCSDILEFYHAREYRPLWQNTTIQKLYTSKYFNITDTKFRNISKSNRTQGTIDQNLREAKDIKYRNSHFSRLDELAWIYANTMEGTWAHAKSKLQRQLGTSQALFPSFMDEFKWRRNTGPNKFGEIMIAIREFHPV